MNLVYVGQAFPDGVTKSIFLAGPTPRTSEVRSWRDGTLSFLGAAGYSGTVFHPELIPGAGPIGYAEQVEWERVAMERADCILFWVPRDCSPGSDGRARMAGLTTNVEFGRWEASGRVVLGFPPNAEHTAYLEAHARRLGVPIATTLGGTVAHALAMVGDGANRAGGECEVPLHVWRTASFQQWYRAQRAAGNRLDHARVEWVFRGGPKRSIVFFWALHADVYVTAESRRKTNEVVLARPDIATVVCYRSDPVRNLRRGDLLNVEVVLIREFRSPAATADGFIREVPGGSSWKPTGDPAALAAEELREETGLRIEPSRVRAVGTRQVAGTLSAHQAHCFAVEVTDDELAWLRSQAGVARGVTADTERTYVEVRTIGELLEDPLTDWANLGMIFAAVQ